MNRVVVISKESPHRLPPVISLIKSLSRQCYDVVFLTTECLHPNRIELEELGVVVVESGQRSTVGLGSVGKAFSWFFFRRFVIEKASAIGEDVLFWISSGDTALALGSYLLDKRYILQLNELYDRNHVYKALLAPFARRSLKVVVPEECRASIFRVWFKLPSTPSVLPNKPSIEDSVEPTSESIGSRNMELLESLENTKLVLYQARMVRMDLLNLGKAVDMIEGFSLGVMGDIRDSEMFMKLSNGCRKIIHFDYVPAPNHLVITRKAHIGVLLYSYESLNNIFCAPNKTWEYSVFSVPMISNQLPMIDQKMKQHHMGEAFDWSDIGSIKDSILKIDNSYDSYSRGAKDYYESCDFDAIVSNIVQIGNG